MTAPVSRSVADALAVARPLVARLSTGGDPEEVAADLIEAWGATENAMRALMGGSALSGQLLISALRQRNLLTIEQAHALLEFLAARDRANEVNYQPTAADVTAAQEGFRRLDQGVLGQSVEVPQLQHTSTYAAIPRPGAGGPPPPPPPSSAARNEPVGVYEETVPARGGQPWGFLVAVLLAAAVLGGLGWYVLRGRGGGAAADVDQGIGAYRQGKLELANSLFAKAAQEDEKSATPHVWLGRVARDQKEDATAAREFQLALNLEPNNAVVHREIGSFHLARGRYDDASRRYIEAIKLDPNDKVSQGWLGCALLRLGRPDQAQTWFNRAGPGDWSTCASGGATGAPGAPPIVAPGQPQRAAPR